MPTATPTTQPAGLWMATSCPACGGPLTIVNTGCSTGRETKTIVQCARPNHGQWLIYCRITPVAEQAGYRGAPHVAREAS